MNQRLISMSQFSLAAATTTAILASALSPLRSHSAAVQTPVQQATVTIEAFEFNPPEIILKKGGSVTFINKDSTPHTVTPEPGTKFKGTGRLSKNESKKVMFNQVGSQPYFCEIHPSMKGTVIVVQ
jgi:plastocyanin